MGVLIKSTLTNDDSREQMLKNIELISNVIIKVIQTADSWKNKKVKKTI